MSREVVWVTPAMAREWLATSTQRWGPAPRTPAKVDKFAGRLEQGHHRLHAVAKANIPVRMPVSTTRTTRRGSR